MDLAAERDWVLRGLERLLAQLGEGALCKWIRIRNGHGNGSGGPGVRSVALRGLA
jgi:hypothetical protein